MKSGALLLLMFARLGAQEPPSASIPSPIPTAPVKPDPKASAYHMTANERSALVILDAQRSIIQAQAQADLNRQTVILNKKINDKWGKKLAPKNKEQNDEFTALCEKVGVAKLAIAKECRADLGAGIVWREPQTEPLKK
jgi:hypothetical protein